MWLQSQVCNFHMHFNDWYWAPQSSIYGKSTMGQVMAWCHQSTSHCWPRWFWPWSFLVQSLGNTGLTGTCTPWNKFPSPVLFQQEGMLSNDINININFFFIKMLTFKGWWSWYNGYELSQWSLWGNWCWFKVLLKLGYSGRKSHWHITLCDGK